MADDWGDALPVEQPSPEVKLFGKWSSDEVHVNDISLTVRAGGEERGREDGE